MIDKQFFFPYLLTDVVQRRGIIFWASIWNFIWVEKDGDYMQSYYLRVKHEFKWEVQRTRGYVRYYVD